MSPDLVILLLQVISTLFMVGVIWFVQIVHYPLMSSVGESGYQDYQNRHQRMTTWVVGPPMLVEAFTSMLLIWYPPTSNFSLLLLGIAMLFVIWVSTLLLSVPFHGQLSLGFDARVHRQLVLTNWLRTVFWSLRGALVCWFVIEKISTLAVQS